MPDSDVVIYGLRKLSVARITYLVIAAMPVAVFLRLVLDPGATKDEGLGDSLQAMLMLMLEIPVVLAGFVILIRNRVKHLALTFWFFAVLFASVPILFIIITLVLEAATGIRIQTF